MDVDQRHDAPTVGEPLPVFAGLPPSAFGDSAVGADAVDGIGAALDSRLAELEKSAQHGRLAQQH
ncbi:hypothetical protein AB0C18_14385 [Nonomuraea muscovyensis]|uniref:hypothetical protein n=1 Tax=Nonomuraea muscovyensis TaxID=1124761 RepID=UPI0033C769F0